ncbi:Lactonase, 7-bladed beta-propeller-domain-containing protein [Pseudomassariella vexata]|uniref:Lactonase, 7-bladed beta-propeller-domain-containing protein n=1 Tax=Pseudomassariella vexata TaxID=1141098 RepID=A0A1Y2DVF4_9PEZI|nr:Lactonase, 7-bladed beta-propeller-domain-containing protein [Pseudomassariella vexata]ORY63270.1 Lactonase, 7-bladed beta-propeller-domain-containing protein [Pseudomassariella vexata]
MVGLLPYILAALGLASAFPLIPRQNNTGTERKLLVSTNNLILPFYFKDNTFIQSQANTTLPQVTPSWLALKEPNLLYAVDENTNATMLFNFDEVAHAVSKEPVASANGSVGTVSLAFNQDKTRLLGASYGGGAVDVWDISSDHHLKLIKSVALEVPGSNAHQALLDPSGRFFVVNDLGGHKIYIIDSKDDKYEIISSYDTPDQTGPRHGAWIKSAGAGNSSSPSDLATHYAVVCEVGNRVLLYKVGSDNGIPVLTLVDNVSTFGDAFPPTTPESAAAGELVVASNQKDIYVSNRITGNETDSISHFALEDYSLRFVDQVSSMGTKPRMMSLSADESILFSSNQNGTNGLVAYKRCQSSGSLDEEPLAVYDNSNFPLVDGQVAGPMFVMEVPVLSKQ